MGDESGADGSGVRPEHSSIAFQEEEDEDSAPEGGWGWVVSFGLATVLIVTLGPMACFGLIFGNFLEGLGEGSSSVTLINSVYMCLHSFTGLLANYALKSYSCRQVAFFGSVLFFVGNLLTSFATSVTYMIFTFAVLPGVGLGLMIPASFHCFNAYFRRRRVFVMGIAQTTLSGGIMLYPIAVERLVVEFGFRGAQLIVAAITLHATLGALTFVPPKPCAGSRQGPSRSRTPSYRKDSLSSQDGGGGGIKMAPDPTEQGMPLMGSENRAHLEYPLRSRRRGSRASIISSGSLLVAGAGSLLMVNGKTTHDNNHSAHNRKWWRVIVNFFDLGLLKDPVYVNLAVGVAFSFYSDFTFVTLFPLFMFSLNYTLSETALCIAIGAASDLVGRVAFSLLGVLCDIRSRTIFLIGSAAMVVGRTAMIYMNDYIALNIANGIHGFFRAWIHANLALVFAEYCPAERFPAAYGLFMTLSGIVGITTGPLMGVIRDVTNSYSTTIHSLNIQMLVCVIPWTLEMIIQSCRAKATKATT